MQKSLTMLSSTSDCEQEAIFTSGTVTVPRMSTTDSSGRAPAKPAISWPNATAWTVATSWRRVRKHSLLPCLREVATLARTQTSLSFLAGVRSATSTQVRLVRSSLWMKRLPNVASSKFVSLTSGPLVLASRAACSSSSLFFFSASLAAFSASFLAFFSGAWPDDFLPFRLEPADASASPSASPPSPSAPEPAASSSAAWASWMREISAVVSSLILSLRQSSSPGPLPRTFSSSARTSFREVFVRSLPFSTAEIVAASSSSGGMAADGSPMALPTTTARSPPRRVA
mmetsp:Transcript_29282/g.86929  ORF Transcript_29282/g.86929 Transcript_29282/m.86929 type:complete len:286 (+) Transcript_29282:1269-2126(+)